uniref:Carboxypeptidase n=1 Tax=Elaeis guineensis var. tenera TaxID=51953 RepID=A0A6J0PS97_ELAGV|nr:serine carboxypeptidase-like 51 isoform X2 [Elaeis guineensis]XP_029116053.1 serine carboxypeptidase-like 51 isoform X2 [Elaeis guineensis]
MRRHIVPFSVLLTRWRQRSVQCHAVTIHPFILSCQCGEAHMFWWLYRSPQRVDNASTPWPTVLWLQGGPGGSGVGIGNFQEIGLLDTSLKPRNSTWLQKEDLLFVDNPVGTGYSFVEDEKLLVKTDWEAATDLTTLLKKLYNENESLQRSPLFIVAESYGGKFAVTLGLSVVKAIKAGTLKLKLGGVVLGDSWISPEDFIFSWGPLLLDVSRLGINDANRSNSVAEGIGRQLAKGQYYEATITCQDLQNQILRDSHGVDFYNFLRDAGSYPISGMAVALSDKIDMKKGYSMYLSSNASSVDLASLMNGVIKEKIKIIPKNVSSIDTFSLASTSSDGSFISCFLRWEGLEYFTTSGRYALYCDNNEDTKAYIESYQNLRFYWILGAGHFVPLDQPCMALKMLGDITQSPAASSSYMKDINEETRC